ncbi:hypothetical protein GCM10023079_41900 [Streptomyces chitinivorans]
MAEAEASQWVLETIPKVPCRVGRVVKDIGSAPGGGRSAGGGTAGGRGVSRRSVPPPHGANTVEVRAPGCVGSGA